MRDEEQGRLVSGIGLVKAFNRDALALGDVSWEDLEQSADVVRGDPKRFTGLIKDPISYAGNRYHGISRRLEDISTGRLRLVPAHLAPVLYALFELAGKPVTPEWMNVRVGRKTPLTHLTLATYISQLRPIVRPLEIITVPGPGYSLVPFNDNHLAG